MAAKVTPEDLLSELTGKSTKCKFGKLLDTLPPQWKETIMEAVTVHGVRQDRIHRALTNRDIDGVPSPKTISFHLDNQCACYRKSTA